MNFHKLVNEIKKTKYFQKVIKTVLLQPYLMMFNEFEKVK